MVKEEDIRTFKWDGGEDNLINFKSDKVPPTPDSFKTFLVLKNGKEIEAPKCWRRKIFKWWHDARKTEIENTVICNVANQLIGGGGPGRGTPIRYNGPHY